MAKKMHDILPPKLARKVENTIKELDGAKKKRKPPVRKETKPQELKKSAVVSAPTPAPRKPATTKRFPLAEILIGSGVIVLILCVWGFLKLPKADVQIWPKTDTLTLSEKVTVNKAVAEINVASKVIPGQYVEAVQENWQSFPATGSASNEGKATGTITIYNKISPASPLTLKTGTHFLSDSGKYFIILDKVVVPAQKNNTPGSITAQVQAEESGDTYNIGSSKFSIPGLNGTSYYYSVYAESKKAMTGGYTGKIKKVTSDDIKTAEETLTKKLVVDAQNSLRDQVASDQVLLDDSITSTTVSASPSVKAGAVVDNFNETVKVKVSAIVFKKDDIASLVAKDLNAKLPAGNNILEDSLTLNYEAASVDVQNGKIAFNVDSTITSYLSIETNSLVDSFVGKSADEVKQVLDQVYEGRILELKVNFWPFWVKKIPDDKGRIKVNLEF